MTITTRGDLSAFQRRPVRLNLAPTRTPGRDAIGSSTNTEFWKESFVSFAASARAPEPRADADAGT